MRQREAESGAIMGLVIVTVLVVGLCALVLSGQIIQVTVPHIIAQIAGPAPASRPVEGVLPTVKVQAATLATSPDDAATAASGDAAVAPADDAAAAAAPPDAAATPSAPAALAVGARARIFHTDGMGVVLYAAPRANARLPAGLLEGTAVTVLDLSGSEWARVQADNRRTGWVHASYLTPAT
jgi:hypothetical protein